MNNTPNANRKHIAIFGNTNSGKSSLLNAILEQEVSLVSEIKGTTTDPVTKACELLPFGPVVFIDTAGLDDKTELAKLRITRTLQILQRTDFAIYVMDITNPAVEDYKTMVDRFNKYGIAHILVINKIDMEDNYEKIILDIKLCDAIYIATNNRDSILNLKKILIDKLQQNELPEIPLVGDLIPYNSTVIMVVPVDSEAPKGRIILPQVQLIRDCLDHGIKSFVVRDSELAFALQEIKNVDLVVTDSQAFKMVNEIVPSNIKLTGFSVLYARHKGDLNAFVDGVKSIDTLKDHSRILVMESCTHNHSHEDIGRIKIPHLLKKHTGKDLDFVFKMGQDFPEDIVTFDLVIHCGSCMLNRKVMQIRVDTCVSNNIPITNYGIILAYLNGILDRSMEIFKI